jgi:ubiquinol-cytochrome c reductase cytochrome b subunit
MFLAILILLLMPFTDLSRLRGVQFRPLNKIAFFIFIGNFLILMQLGAKHVESPYIEFGQVSTVIYFSYFLLMVPGLSIFENTLLVLGSFEKVLNKKIRSYTTSLATNINPKKRNTLVPLSEPRLILDNSYEINSFISMKRSFSSTTRTFGKETSDQQLNQKVENLNLSFDSEQEVSSSPYQPLNTVDSEDSEDRASLNPKDLVHKEIEDVVLNYVREKKPTEKGPYNPDNESDV